MNCEGPGDPGQCALPHNDVSSVWLGPLDAQGNSCSYLSYYQGAPTQPDQGLLELSMDDLAMLDNMRSSFCFDALPVAFVEQPFSRPQMAFAGQTHGPPPRCRGGLSGLFEAYDDTLSPTSSMGATYSQLSDYSQGWAYQLPGTPCQEAGADDWTPNLLYASCGLSSSSLTPSAAMSTVDDAQNPRNSVSKVIHGDGASRRPSVASMPSPRPPKPSSKAESRSTKRSTKPVAKKATDQLHAPRLAPRKVTHRGPPPPPPPPAPLVKDFQVGNDEDEDDDYDDSDDQFSAERQRARNRLATSKCRAKAKAAHTQLEEHTRVATEHHDGLVASVAQLRDQVLDLKSEVLLHVDCGCPLIQGYIKNAARHLGEGIPGPVGMPPGMPRIELAELEDDPDHGDD